MFAMAAYILGVMFCMGLILGAIALAIRFWYLTLGLIALAVMLVAGSIRKAHAGEEVDARVTLVMADCRASGVGI